MSVQRKELESVLSELNTVKELIPQVLNSELISAYEKSFNSQQELLKLRTENSKHRSEAVRWKRKYETTETLLKTEKELHHKAKRRVTGLEEQLRVEVDYCARLGASSCSLLWLSSKEGLVTSLHTTSMKKFVETFEQTITNFVGASLTDKCDEVTFVQAMCGVFTNISASSEGRDYLIENGKSLITSLIELLDSMKSNIMKLVLMFLYNISVQSDGQTLLLADKQLLSKLDTILSKTTEGHISIGCLRLIGSLSEDSEVQLYSVISSQTIEKCLADKHKDVRAFAKELFAEYTTREA